MGVISDVRTGIKNAVSGVAGIAAVYDYQTDNPLQPGNQAGAIIVSWPDVFDPHIDLEGDSELTIPVKLLVPLGNDQVADNALEALIESVVTAIEAAPTLGGVSDSVVVKDVRNVGRYQIGQDVYALGCEINVQVLT